MKPSMSSARSARSASPTSLGRVALILLAVVVFLGCGATTTVVVQGGGNSPTATATHAAPTHTPVSPTPTPTPGHLIVTIIPNSSVCSGSGCNPYVCHNGTTCNIDWACTTPAWPTIQLSNSGQKTLSWSTTITQYNPSAPPWSLSATHGTLTSGATKNITITNGSGGGGMQVVFHGPAQTVTLSITCGAG